MVVRTKHLLGFADETSLVLRDQPSSGLAGPRLSSPKGPRVLLVPLHFALARSSVPRDQWALGLAHVLRSADCFPLHKLIISLGELLSFGLEERWKNFVQ
jgi:hypothetical protein